MNELPEEIPQEILDEGVLFDPDVLATGGGVLLNVPRDKRVELAEALQEGAADVPPHLRGAQAIEVPDLPDEEALLLSAGAIELDFPDPEPEATEAEVEPEIVIAGQLTRDMF